MLVQFTGVLADLGFTPDTSGEGLQHRWRRPSDGAQIDVLLPDGAGQRVAGRRGGGVRPRWRPQAVHKPWPAASL